VAYWIYILLDTPSIGIASGVMDRGPNYARYLGIYGTHWLVVSAVMNIAVF